MAFTPEQQSAIDQRKKTLLVSAGAGAGKTTTLTNRIICSLLDPEHPADITRMLIITYTKASAADLRAHVRDALRRACEADPTNTRLAQQLSALPSAQISTVDSFFYKIIKEHAAEAGVSPYVRIADEAEKTILMRDLMARLVAELYEGERADICTPEEFCALAEILTDPKQEAEICDILLDLYAICANYPQRTGYLAALADQAISEAELPIGETLWGKYILRRTVEFCQTAKQYLTAAADAAKWESPDNIPAIDKAHQSDMAILQNMIDSTAVSFAQTKEAFVAFAPAALKNVKVKEGEALENYKSVREAYKADVRELRKTFYEFPPAEWKAAMTQTGHYTRLACRIVDGFTAAYQKEKDRRRICDFSDLEHKLCALLYDGEQPSAIALSIAKEFDYIYVDEYQDINRMQHQIISAISRPDNRFMVGDIKQSIYSFRRAEPSLFASMKKSYPLLKNADNSHTAAIYLSQNFRSTQKTIAGINQIFDFLFGYAGESIGYEAEDQLICGNGIPGEAEPKVVLCYRKTKEKGKTPLEDNKNEDYNPFDEEGSPSDEEVTEEEEENEEATYVAEEIKRLLSMKNEDGSPRYLPGNIAILLRSVKKKGNRYALALTEMGIGVDLADAKDFFLVPEVLLCLCLLNAVDNPQRDIYLAGLMQSPLYGFSQDDLTHIRLETGRDMPLYYSLLQYAEKHPSDKACQRILEDLRRYRTLSESLPTDRLLRRMYDETGLLSLSGKDGGGRENLLLLYHYARTFEGSDFKGLHSFIDYLNQIIQTGNTIKTPAQAVPDMNKVRIMTIHASKGLEFPVTFVSGCGTGFSDKDLRKKMLFHPAYGLAFALRDQTGFVALETPLKQVVKDAMRQSAREEEMRVLYVALTRAKERLYITARAPQNNSLKSFYTKLRCIKLAPTPYSILDCNNHFQMVAAAVRQDQLEIEMPSGEIADRLEEQKKEVAPPSPALLQELEQRFAFVYPYEYLHRIPGKIAVSRLTPTVLDGTEDELPLLAKAREGRILPKFYQPEEGHTPAERGTATHLFMQFCNFDQLAHKGVKTELDRLMEQKFIDQTTADLVRTEEIERFRKSPFFQTLLEAKEIKREFRFHVRLPASEYTADQTLKFQLTGEYILVQGVIDCMLFDGDGNITLIDYKTDRLTKEELSNPALAHEKLFSRHAEQLKYYALAIAEIYGRAPAKIGLYALHAGQVYWA